MTLEQNNKFTSSVLIPPILYGTAWKEEKTQELVLQALSLGFKGIDTANQRKHYFEEAVGLAVEEFLENSQSKRSQLFIQTKFTSAHGQDDRKPYDARATLTNQVRQSFESSLNHLKTDYIDSYILHGPTSSQGINNADLEIWQAMEALVNEGKVKFLGISNVNIEQLKALYESVSIKPTFIQNRCFAVTQWDREIRVFSSTNNIIYQGFSLLTANQAYLLNVHTQSLAVKYNKTIAQVIFRFASQIEILALTGTTNAKHMQDDLNINNFMLSSEEIHYLENIALIS